MKTIVISAVVLMLAASAPACIGCLPPPPLRLEVHPDGMAYLMNPHANNINIMGFEIWSAGGLLNPSPPEVYDETIGTYYHPFSPTTNWTSITDYLSVQPDGTSHSALLTALPPVGPGILGPSGIDVIEYSNTPGLLSEVFGWSSTQYVRVRPAGSPPIPLGRITDNPIVGDLTFYYALTTDPGTKFTADIVYTPEPVALALLAGGAAALRRRRRAVR